MAKGKSKGVRKTKLLVEIATAVLPIFIFVSGLVAFVLYRSSIDNFVASTREMLSAQLENTFGEVGYLSTKWFYDYWAEHPDKSILPITDVEEEELYYYMDKRNYSGAWDQEFVSSIDDERVQELIARDAYNLMKQWARYDYNQREYDTLFIFDATEENMGLIFLELNEVGDVRRNLGEHLDLDLKDHPVLAEAIKTNSSKIVYEKSKNFPTEGYYYLVYKPIIFDGKIRAFVGVGVDYSAIHNQVMSQYSLVTLISIMGIGFLFAVLFLLILFRSIEPVRKIQSAVRSYIHTKNSGDVINKMNSITMNNEIGQLSDDVVDLVKEIDKYTEDIVAMTSERQRVATELDMAKNIQEGQLPSKFPAFPDRNEFDIYASMTAAKEVGGDFYDFFFVDDDHLALVMADVSGKGVPAALFMMMSKMLIHNYAMIGLSPHEVLERTNNSLFENNPEKMFVTVWFGILEISTGKIIAANAGHEYPILKQPGGEFELFKDKHGFVLGGFRDKKYKEYEFTLQKGGTLFVYTDGVPEATNASGEMYGTERLVNDMNRDGDRSPEEILKTVHADVDKFVGDADQFDDLTMMAIKLF